MPGASRAPQGPFAKERMVEGPTPPRTAIRYELRSLLTYLEHCRKAFSFRLRLPSVPLCVALQHHADDAYPATAGAPTQLPPVKIEFVAAA